MQLCTFAFFWPDLDGFSFFFCLSLTCARSCVFYPVAKRGARLFLFAEPLARARLLFADRTDDFERFSFSLNDWISKMTLILLMRFVLFVIAEEQWGARGGLEWLLLGPAAHLESQQSPEPANETAAGPARPGHREDTRFGAGA